MKALGSAEVSAPHDALPADERSMRDAVISLVAWMTATATHAALAPPPPLRQDARVAAEPWRPADGALTPAPPAPASAGRLVVEVTTAELGQVRVTIDRSPSGLHVIVGVRPEQAGALELHRRALEDALAAAGMGAATVQVARLDEDGTELALSTGGRTSENVDSCELGGVVQRRTAAPDRSRRRRLDTLG